MYPDDGDLVNRALWTLAATCVAFGVILGLLIA